jgi:hypothetical protein
LPLNPDRSSSVLVIFFHSFLSHLHKKFVCKKQFDFDVEEAERGGEFARTTLMIRNIPNKYSQRAMLSVLDRAGVASTFDFFYLPVDFRNRCNLGYAFINFVCPADAARLFRGFHGRRWEEQHSRKVCEVKYARVQGRSALVTHFRTAKFPQEDSEGACQPVVYRVVEGRAVEPLPIHAHLAQRGEEEGEVGRVEGEEGEEEAEDGCATAE